MSPLEVAACAGSALLVVTAALPAAATARRGITLFTLAASIGLSAVFVHWIVGRADYVPKNRVSRLMKYGVEELRKAREKVPDNLIVIEGGSYSAHAVNSKLLREELRQLGYQSRVVQMSLGAANHFERHRLFSDMFERQMPPARSEKNGNVLVLSEVHSTYDHHPLVQLEENADTDRTYHYMTPVNAWYALRSVLDDALNDDEDQDPLGEQAHLVWTIARHTLINVFNVGLASRITPMKSVKELDGSRAGRIQKGFRFGGLAKTLAVAKAPLKEFTAAAVPHWLLDVREARLKQLWGDRYDKWLYFSVPSTKMFHAAWTRTFCNSVAEPCLAVDDVKLIEQLDERKYWKDTGHMTALGSQIYTRWLAGHLDRQNMLIRSSRPSKRAALSVASGSSLAPKPDSDKRETKAHRKLRTSKRSKASHRKYVRPARNKPHPKR